MKSWAGIVKKNKSQSQQLTSKLVKEAVRHFNQEEKGSKNLIIYGCEEKEDEGPKDVIDIVDEVYRKAGNFVAPSNMADCYRMGKKEPGKIRPIKAEFNSSGDVQFILTHARKLRTSEINKGCYLAPDRTKEGRTEHNKLVKRMKEMIANDSSRHFFIKNNKISSVQPYLCDRVCVKTLTRRILIFCT